MTAYAELHCRSHFSFLDGASSPAELVKRALALGYEALALTDVNGLYGAVEARESLLEASGLQRRTDEPRSALKLIYGSELVFADGDCAVALVRDRSGWRNLSSLITRGRLAAPKGECRLSFDDLAGHDAGLLVLAGGPRSTAMRLLCAGEMRQAEQSLGRWRDVFGPRLHVEVVRHQAPGELERSQAMAALARRLGIPLLATGDVHFHVPERKPCHDLMRCIQGGWTLVEAGRRLLPNAEAHLRPPPRLAALFPDLPEAVERTVALARAVDFRLCDVTYLYPAPELPPGEDADTVLARLARAGLSRRLATRKPAYVAEMQARMTEELALIAELQYAGYFLTMWEVVEECARRRILCQGRGSAANSLVCFALGITSVPPDAIRMLFERFISKERNEPPDIDLDIEHERREEIIQWVYAKYGRDHAAMVAEVIRYRWRSALRDVGRAIGFPEAQLGRMSKFLSHYMHELDQRALAACGVDADSKAVRTLLEHTRAMEGIPRHLSIHVGGFVLSGEPLHQIVPLENGRMADRTVIQWSKDDVDSMGMFKLDLLGLGMLTMLRKAFTLIRETRGHEFTLENVEPDDPATYQMLRKADSVGVFQVESRAQMNMLPRLKPETFYDLVIEVAIVRPGPIQGKMVHPFLRRKRKLEEVEYPHPSLKPILERTLGVPLFQEQVMSLAVAVAGYTPGEADQLRRDMASWRAEGKMERHRLRLLAGMHESGLTPEYAERVFQQIQGFGSYGFPESHAAAFAQLAYVSAYLKCHYPCEFACALLNSQPMGFYSPAIIVNDFKRHGGAVHPVDVQRSAWDTTIEDGGLRIGLRQIRGLGEEAGQTIARARAEGGPFRSMEDFARRVALPTKALVPLAAGGALRGFAPGRRDAIWRASDIARRQGTLFAGIGEGEAPPKSLPPLYLGERLALDSVYTGTFPDRHPMELVRDELTRAGVLSARALASADLSRRQTVAGLVITRQRPQTASGMVFMTLEDETGQVDVSVLSAVFERFQPVIRFSVALIVEGRVVADGEARNVMAADIRPLTIGHGLQIVSHDFH